MVVIRCSKRLLEHVGPPASDAGRSTTRLGDWYVNLIHVGRQRFVVCISEHARLAVLLRGRELKLLGAHLAAALGAVLQRLGVKHDCIAEELAQMQNVTIAVTTNRSLVASMNDYARLVRYDEQIDDLLTVSLRLAETPILVLDGESPKNMVRGLFGVSRAMPKLPPISAPQPPKAINRLLHYWSAVAHERELGRALDVLREQFDRRARGELTALELSEQVYHFHQETARNIWHRYSNNFHEMQVATAIARGFITRDELPDELLTYLDERDR